MGGRIVRMADLEIDPAELDAYNALLAEEIEASIRLEPGVLMPELGRTVVDEKAVALIRDWIAAMPPVSP